MKMESAKAIFDKHFMIMDALAAAMKPETCAAGSHTTATEGYNVNRPQSRAAPIDPLDVATALIFSSARPRCCAPPPTQAAAKPPCRR
jgi:hypothetical protein